MSVTVKWWEKEYPARYYAYPNTTYLLGGYPSVGWIDVSIYSATSNWIPAASDMIALTEDEWNKRSLGPQIIKDGKVQTYVAPVTTDTGTSSTTAASTTTASTATASTAS